MSKLRINLGCWNYDRTRALADGSVQPDGIDLNYLDMPVEETFFRMLRYREFEAAELSLSSYTRIRCRVRSGRSSRSRSSRRASSATHRIYVNTASGIREPKDLVGKRVGMPEYQMTAPVWIRGILADALRGAGRQRHVFHGRRGRARARREDQARPAGEHQGATHRRPRRR